MSVPVFTQSDADELLRMLAWWKNFPKTRPSQPTPPPPISEEELWIPYVNKSGSTIPKYGLFCTDDYISYSNHRRLEAKQPGTTWRHSYYVNGPVDIPDQCPGVAQGTPVVLFAYDSGTPANGEGWGLKPSQFTASKGYPGLIVEGIDDSTNKIARGRWLPITALLAKTTGSVSVGSTTAYRIYAGTAGSESDAGFTTVPTAQARTAIASGKWCLLFLHQTCQELTPLEC